MSEQFFAGPGSLEQLPRMIRDRFGPNAPVLVFHGKTSYAASGAQGVLEAARDIAWHGHDRVKINPDVESLEAGFNEYRKVNPVAVVAIGGGSVIDTAKGVLALVGGASVPDVLGGNYSVPMDRPVFIAVPTTAGSGSEATHFAVVYRDDVKFSVANKRLQPDVVILDPDLLRSCTRSPAFASGADAVCQCVESWWNRNATAESRAFAEEGLGLLLSSFFSSGHWQDKLLGAHKAGQAINVTKTTGGHALSYGLTTATGVPHGFAVLAVMQKLVLLMDEQFGFFRERHVLDTLFRDFGNRFPDAFDRFAENVWSTIPIDHYFAHTPEDFGERLVSGVNAERLRNHPVPLTDEHIRWVYTQVLKRHQRSE